MATMTADTEDFYPVTVRELYGGAVMITGPFGSTIEADGPSLIEAVQKELGILAVPEGMRLVPADAIVIGRATLPEVEPSPDGARGYNIDRHLMGDSPLVDATLARRTALRWLALAEYLDAHPPIDEAQVTAVAEEVAVAFGSPRDTASGWTDIARRLVEAGVRVSDMP